MILSESAKREIERQMNKAAERQARARIDAEVTHWQTMHDREPNVDEIENIVVSYYDQYGADV